MLQVQRQLSKSFYALLSLPATAMGFALSIQISALSWLLTTRYNLHIDEVGYVWAAGPLAGIFGQVIIGLISDKVWFWGGRRRPFVLIGGTLAAGMLLALPNIDAINASIGIGSMLAVAIAVALTLDLAINISFNPTRSIIADVTPEGNPRTRGYTWMQTISGLFGVMAYLIGATFGNYVLISVGVVVVFFFSVVPMFFITEERSSGSEGTAAASAGSTGATEWGQLWRIYIAHGFSWIGIQTMFVYIIAFIQQKYFVGVTDQAQIDAGSGQIIAIAFAVLNTVGFILPALALEPVVERIGRVRTHMVCVAVMALGYGAIAIAGNTPTLLYCFMAVVGIGWAAVVSLPFAIMTEKIDAQRTGMFMGIFNLSVVLPQLIVSLFVGTIILRAEDKNVIFLLSAASLLISAILWTTVKEHRRVGGSQPGNTAPGGAH